MGCHTECADADANAAMHAVWFGRDAGSDI